MVAPLGSSRCCSCHVFNFMQGKNKSKEKEQTISECEIVLCMYVVEVVVAVTDRHKEREKEVVGVQPREVEEQIFEMEKGYVVLCCVFVVNDKVLRYAFLCCLGGLWLELLSSIYFQRWTLLLVYGNLKKVTFKLQTQHAQSSLCLHQHNTIRQNLGHCYLLLLLIDSFYLLSHFVYYVNPTHNP